MTTENYFESEEYKQEHAAYLEKRARLRGEALTLVEEPAVEAVVAGSTNPMTLVDHALDHTLALIRRHNEPNETHVAVLRHLVVKLVECVRLALGKKRIGVPIPTGGGKTSALRGLLHALHHHDQENIDHGVLILVEQIEAGKKLLHELIEEDGVAANAVCHVHSDLGGAVAEDAAHFRFVIATHEKSKREDIVRLLNYQGRRRAVLVDEALHATAAWGKKIEVVKSALDTGMTQGESLKCDELSEWSRRTQLMLEAARLNLQHDGIKEFPIFINPPEWDVDPTLRALKLAPDTHTLRLLLNSARQKSEFNLTAAGVLQHRRVLPEGLDDNVVYLDAGGQMDMLFALDLGFVSIVDLPDWPEGLDLKQIKSWEQVELHHMKAPGGSYRQVEDPQRRKLYAREAARFIVKHSKPGDQVLVCLYKKILKKQKADIIQALRDNLGANLEVDGDRREHPHTIWVRFINWGRHHSTNDFQEARVGVALGDFPISDDTARAWARGQQTVAGEAKELTWPELKKLHGSYCATKLLQLFGRLRNRQVEDGGVAKSSVIGFITHRSWRNAEDPSDVGSVELLMDAMPGAKLLEWETPAELIAVAAEQRMNSTNRRRQAGGQVEATAKRIREVLPTLESGGHVATRRLRWLCGFPKELSSKMFSRGITRAIEGTNWGREGQSLVWVEPEVSIEELFPY